MKNIKGVKEILIIFSSVIITLIVGKYLYKEYQHYKGSKDYEESLHHYPYVSECEHTNNHNKNCQKL